MKKFITLALIAAMMLSMIVVGTSAAAWDGTTSTAFTGTGTADDPYVIASAENLKSLQEQVAAGETYAGKYFKQTADIDLNNKEFAPIMQRTSGKEGFGGLYDGNGYKITNFYQSFSYGFGGLFGYITTDTTFTPGVINLTLEGKMDAGTKSGGVYTAALVGWAERCPNTDAGRIIIANCVVDVDMTLDNGLSSGTIYVGAVCARAQNVDMVNCVNKGDVTVKVTAKTDLRVGGFGAWTADSTYNNCHNYGKVSGTSTDYNKNIYVGGFFASSTTSTVLTFENCVNYGEVNGLSATIGAVGGIMGWPYAGRLDIKNCANVGAVTSVNTYVKGTDGTQNSKLPYAGGILGWVPYPNTTAVNCYNTGVITTEAKGDMTGHNPGGIVGVMNNAANTTYIKDCLTTTSSFKGWMNAANTAEGCVANADAAVVNAAIKTIEDVYTATTSATVSGTVFNFVAPRVPAPETTAPETTTPAAPETTAAPTETTAAPAETTAAPAETTAAPSTPSTPNTGDVTSVILLALVAACAGAVLTIKKTK